MIATMGHANMVNEATRRVGWEPVIDVAVMRFVGAHLLLNWEPCSGVACSYAGRGPPPLGLQRALRMDSSWLMQPLTSPCLWALR
jgi:hypothetical protein